MPEVVRLLLADAQTSGGLLLLVAADAAGALVRRLADEGHAAAQVSEVTPHRGDAPRIVVRA